MDDLVTRQAGVEFDHFVLGTSDTRAGAAWLEALTGAPVTVTEPEPGQWYWSGAMPLPGGALVEMLGPNPAHRGFQPMKALLADYTTPSPLFWHIGTRDFDALSRRVAELGAPMERVERIDAPGKDGPRAHVRGILGPGFRSARPCAIQWIDRIDRGEAVCSVKGFALRTPRPGPLNAVFEGLGLTLRAEEGPERLTLELETPKGEVVLSGPGVAFEGLGALAMIARLRLRSLFGG
ncbi:MAG: VOC family protein [Pseudomonadota bacterium]